MEVSKVSTPNIEEMLNITTYRNNIYGFLAVCLFNPAGKVGEKILREKTVMVRMVLDSLDKLSKTSFFEPIDCLNQLLNEEIDDLKLKVEYTKLFITSYPKVPCPPYESVYRTEDRLTMRESTLDVLRFYNRFKLNLSEEFKEPPDHVAVELEFMYFLTSEEVKAWRKGNQTEAYRYLEAEAEFLSNHLIKWIPNFCRCVKENGKILFYKSVTCFLEKFTEMDLKFIRKLLNV